jgi:hypothetical protein
LVVDQLGALCQPDGYGCIAGGGYHPPGPGGRLTRGEEECCQAGEAVRAGSEDHGEGANVGVVADVGA